MAKRKGILGSILKSAAVFLLFILFVKFDGPRLFSTWLSETLSEAIREDVRKGQLDNTRL